MNNEYIYINNANTLKSIEYIRNNILQTFPINNKLGHIFSNLVKIDNIYLPNCKLYNNKFTGLNKLASVFNISMYNANASSMFYICPNLVGVNTINIYNTNASSMFSGCTNLTNVNNISIENGYTSSMFSGCIIFHV